MRATKAFHLFIATFLPFWLPACFAAVAEPAYAGTSNSPPVRFEVRHEAGPGLSATDRAYVTAGTNTYGFQMPTGFRLEPSTEEKVRLVSADYNCLLVWRNLGHVLPESSDLDPAQCRKLLLQRQPDAKIMEEFTLGALGRRGPAFDVRWNGSGGMPRRERVVFIAAQAGIMEFSMVSSLDKFEAASSDFDLLRLSFRASDAKGKLEMPVLSDKL